MTDTATTGTTPAPTGSAIAADNNVPGYTPVTGSTPGASGSTAAAKLSTHLPLPSDIANGSITWTDFNPASPGVKTTAPTETKQVGGAPAPDVRRAANLMSLLDAIQSATPFTNPKPRGEHGIPPNERAKAPSDWDNPQIDADLTDIAGLAGDETLADKFKAGTLTAAERETLAGATTTRIYKLLGIRQSPAAGVTTQQIRSMKIPAGVAKSLRAQGVDVSPTDTIGAASDEVQRIPAGHDVTTGGQPITEGPSAPATSQKMDMATAYGQMQKEYQSDPKTWTTILSQFGLDTTGGTASADQVDQAMFNLLTEASKSGQDLATVIKSQTKTDATPGKSEAYSYVQSMAANYGVTLSPDQVTAIADQYGTNTSENEDQIKAAIISKYDPTTITDPSGVAATVAGGIQDVAGQYFLPMSSQQLAGLVKNALSSASVESIYQTSENAVATYTEQAKQQAISLYPTLADAITRGVTVQDAASPYASVAQSVLGVDPSTIDWSQQKWRAALNSVDPKTGQATGSPMSLDQWTKTMMEDPQYGYDHTQMAMDRAASMGDAILATFGKVSGGSSFSYSPSTSSAMGG